MAAKCGGKASPVFLHQSVMKIPDIHISLLSSGTGKEALFTAQGPRAPNPFQRTQFVQWDTGPYSNALFPRCRDSRRACLLSTVTPLHTHTYTHAHTPSLLPQLSLALRICWLVITLADLSHIAMQSLSFTLSVSL